MGDVVPRPDGWEFTHEREAAVIARDGWMCERHQGVPWPHDDCPGPGMAWVVEGREAIERVAAR